MFGFLDSKTKHDISKNKITKKLNKLNINISSKDIEIYDSIPSTNKKAKELARLGVSEGHIVISYLQTEGYGRYGREFFSPKNTGLYMSLVLKPNSFKTMEHITTMAAVSVCKAVESICDKKAEVKWVNDIYVNGQKVCGILAESVIDSSLSNNSYVVLGIGVNIFAPYGGFPKEIEKKAGFILQKYKKNIKNIFISQFLYNFFNLYKFPDKKDYINEYRKRSFIIGKNITVIKEKKEIAATAINIDDECKLIVRYTSGAIEALNSGEVSLIL